MDTNIKLIRTVKQNPVLYRKNVSLVDRREGWKQLAEQFNMPEQNIKSRWHFLVQNFLHNKTCTYKKEMSFMIPHLSVKPNITKITAPNESSNIINPEFYITEKDIENPSDNEDYVFLEVEQLDENGDEVTIVEEAITTNNYLQEVEVKTHKVNNLDKKSVQQKSTEKPKQNIKTEDEQKPKQEHAEKEQCSNDEIIIPDIVTVNTSSNNNIQSHEETTKVETDKSADSEDEDMIFCKLVMAMMQKMDSEKKFKVKKDIMQILFS
ncbi:uncharacterized protein LOC119671748 [Teleopsis dalmanni]|uniref:uncharacterized protein LOC119671748 n=1 Tax=Teleopsis dalmanni TaxID=139649 RepID=UPI0018CEFA1F|nr:uncharacterized protein LOC119671748 [Teleopsis dalmanni]